MGTRIVHYDASRAEEVAALERILWREGLRENLAHLRWKYADTPLREHGFMLLALHDGRVVGARGFVGRRWEAGAGDASFLAPQAADLVIEPAHRRSGLLGDLTGAALEHARERDLPLALNFSAGPVTRMTSLVDGWRELGPLQEAGRAASPLARIRGHLPGRGDPFRAFSERRLPSRRTPAGPVEMASAPRPAEMAALVERLPRSGRIRERRDEDWFRWRFANPKVCNRFVFCGDRTLDGYLVVQMRRHRLESPVGLVDCEAVDASVEAELLRTAARWTRHLRVSIWLRALSEPGLRTLRAEGFSPWPVIRGVRSPTPGILLKPLRPGAEAAIEAASGRHPGRLDDWELRMIQSDAH